MTSTDRIAGTLLGLACGDALGAGYEFQPSPLAPDEDARMKGGGSFGWAPGEWTDDTQMAICIAQVTATGELDEAAIGDRFLAWLRSGPVDVGIQTRRVLGRADSGSQLPVIAAEHFAANPRGAAGNGSLMRTAPIALASVGDDAASARCARAVSALTHGDPLAGDACVLWCVAIDRAVREERLDGIRDGLRLLDVERRGEWEAWIDEAETRPPAAFVPNGYVVTALQAAHAAIHHTSIPDDEPCRHLQHALHAAVRIGHDTDTVAAIAGSLLGARWGASAIPFTWRRLLHGWPGYRASDLVRLAVLTASRSEPDRHGWPAAPHLSAQGEEPWTAAVPDDEDLLLGPLAALDEDLDVDAVVSLCRVGTDQIPAGVEHHEVVLTDRADAASNPNLDFVLHEAARAVATLRSEGKRVFLHCVGGRSRTPTVAALYLAQRRGIPAHEALEQVARAVPEYDPHNRAFRDVIARYTTTEGGPR